LNNLPAFWVAVTPELPAQLVTSHIGRVGSPTTKWIVRNCSE
jgi:hypothetical protein